MGLVAEPSENDTFWSDLYIHFHPSWLEALIWFGYEIWVTSPVSPEAGMGRQGLCFGSNSWSWPLCLGLLCMNYLRSWCISKSVVKSHSSLLYPSLDWGVPLRFIPQYRVPWACLSLKECLHHIYWNVMLSSRSLSESFYILVSHEELKLLKEISRSIEKNAWV